MLVTCVIAFFISCTSPVFLHRSCGEPRPTSVDFRARILFQNQHHQHPLPPSGFSLLGGAPSRPTSQGWREVWLVPRRSPHKTGKCEASWRSPTMGLLGIVCASLWTTMTIVHMGDDDLWCLRVRWAPSTTTQFIAQIAWLHEHQLQCCNAVMVSNANHSSDECDQQLKNHLVHGFWCAQWVRMPIAIAILFQSDPERLASLGVHTHATKDRKR